MKTIRILPAAVLAVLLAAPPARAQDEPVLPDLTPQEVEIRGELTIRFPSLRRQPLVGFNPPPRIPDIAAGRTPFAEPYKQERADLPPSPLRSPSAPAVASYLDGPVFTGQVEGGAGRYTERYLLADVSSAPRSAVRWDLDGSYHGRSGYEAWPGTGANAEYEQGDFAVRGAVPLGSFELGAHMRGVMSRYLLYGVVRSDRDVTADYPERDVRGGSVGASFARTRGSLRFSAAGALQASSVRTDAAGPNGELVRGTDREDRTTVLEGSVESVGPDLGLWLDAAWSRTAPVDDGTSAATSDRYVAGGGVAMELGRIGRLRAGVKALGSGRDALTDTEEAPSFDYISPDLRLDAAIGPNLRLVLTQTPHADAARLLDLYGEQPFIVHAPVVESEVWPIDAHGRLVAALGSVEIALAGGYRRSPNRRWFEHDPSNPLDLVRGISSVNHGRARETSGEVDVTTYFGASMQVGLGATLRSGRLTDLEADIPYFAPWTLRSLVSLALFDGRGLFQATARMEGPRERDLAGAMEKLPAFADLDLLASYRVTRNASVVLRLDNLGGDRPEWDRYLRPPAIFTAGVSWEW